MRAFIVVSMIVMASSCSSRESYVKGCNTGAYIALASLGFGANPIPIANFCNKASEKQIDLRKVSQ